MRRRWDLIGTFRGGQAFLGVAGLVFGVGSGSGLMLWPEAFEPMLRAALIGAEVYLHFHHRYEPWQRPYYAGLLVFLGTFWFGLMVYAFIRQPKRDAALDAYLTRHDGLDTARVATVSATDDPRN